MILDDIVKVKQREVKVTREYLREIKAKAKDAEPPRGFAAALKAKEGPALIAEIKRASPAKGPIHLKLDVGKQAAAYADGGAHALSVLTDKQFFKGSLDDLKSARGAGLPALRKDFIIDDSQIWEARAAGADAILLIVRILSKSQIREFEQMAAELGMATLVEVHHERELEAAAGARIVGINNRDLDTFKVDLETTARIKPEVPHGTIVVAESGIRERKDVIFMQQIGVDAVLVGEELSAAADPAAKIRELLGKPTPEIKLIQDFKNWQE